MPPCPTGLLALLALAFGACAADAAETVVLNGPEGVALRTVVVLPPEGRAGVPVVALHGCGGIGGPDAAPQLPERERAWAERLAAAGHPVLFPDSFGSRGFAEVCGQPSMVPSRTVRRGDAFVAAAWAAAQPWAAPGGGTILLGWSHGGSTVLAVAADPAPPMPIRAVVAYYPGCRGFAGSEWKARTPTILLLGDADDWTAPAPCQALAAAGGAEARTYPGARHGFDHPDQPPGDRTLPNGRVVGLGTDRAARDASIREVEAFLQAHAAPPR
jgi:dienelactone hydrolase